MYKEGRKEAVEPGRKKKNEKKGLKETSLRGGEVSRYLGLASTFRLSQGYVPKDRLKRNPQKGWRKERENEKARHQAKVRRKEAKSEEKSG